MKPRTYFLIDGFGALLSAFLLGVVLRHFQSFIGMPSNILYNLALIACFISLYSFSCYLSRPENWRQFLKVAGFLNLVYCGLTLALTFYYFQELTSLGITYFMLEIAIMVGLALWELKRTNV